jgi:hypothetical protein
MATVQPNNIKISVAPKSIFELLNGALVASDEAWEQGDFLVYDSVNNLVTTPSDEAACVTFLGIARQTIVDGKEQQPYVTATSAAQAKVGLAGPLYGVVAEFYLKASDTFTQGALVYVDPTSNLKTVQATGTKAIGVFQDPTVASAAAGSVGNVLVGARYPSDALRF